MDGSHAALAEGSFADLMPTVMHGEPGAVLLVGVSDGLVRYANPVAEQLAPGVELPCLVDDWSRAAQLEAADGSPLDHPELGLATSPLSRIAQGRPVNGERISAGRSTEMSTAREALWVIGVPFDDNVTEALQGLALVALLPVRDVERPAQARKELQDSAERLHSRAVVASDLSFTISDPSEPDNPLVWVNPAFERVTGYGSEMVGQNCRFLQGPDTDPAAVQRIRDALAAGETITELLLNYRKDGSAFWNEVVISPVRDASGKVTHHVGVQSDVTTRVRAEQERDAALVAARSARGRLEFLSRVADELSAELDPRTAQDLLPSLVVPDLAHWGFATIIEHEGPTRSRGPLVRAAHSDPALAGLALRFAEQASSLSPESLTVRVLSGQTGPTLVPDVTMDDLERGTTGELGRDQLRQLGLGSAIVVPLRARGVVIGALTLLSGPNRPAFDEEDLLTAADLGVRAGLALENARLYADQRRSNETLQRAMLSTPRTSEGLEVVTRYLPAGEAAQVGGDWYDAFPLSDGSTVVVIGDVMGHDVSAAASMGQLRTLVRGIAYDRGCEPVEVLSRLDASLHGLGIATLATAIVMQITPTEDGEAHLVRWCTAGHLPPVLRSPDGTTDALQGVGFILGLGLGGDAQRHQHERILAPGSTLLLYTDGLVERRDVTMDSRLEQLHGVIAAGEDLPLSELCDEVLRRMLPHGNDDDVAVVAVRTG